MLLLRSTSAWHRVHIQGHSLLRKVFNVMTKRHKFEVVPIEEALMSFRYRNSFHEQGQQKKQQANILWILLNSGVIALMWWNVPTGLLMCNMPCSSFADRRNLLTYLLTCTCGGYATCLKTK